MSAASLALFLVGAVVAGSAFGAVVIGSLSAANRLAAPGTRAKVISTIVPHEGNHEERDDNQS
jgi:hypothetical protein